MFGLTLTHSEKINSVSDDLYQQIGEVVNPYKKEELSQQEKSTMETIVDESSYTLSIVIVSVGDVPWADMRKFDDMIPKREFNNIQVSSHFLF
ncbi:hypothetical protein DY000_02062942 [Brassica cretica]|uniref:Copine C-terminal domain-containing protein n=1 Tax=Brassica cretica TaxID=69181 RepID=A0ABQ7AV22_BRACR|nr:hypothetical protein DY000_02062942 [Brassica cretica]